MTIDFLHQLLPTEIKKFYNGLVQIYSLVAPSILKIYNNFATGFFCSFLKVLSKSLLKNMLF